MPLRTFSLLVLSTSLVCSGCMHRIPINPDVRPGVEYPSKLRGPFALCILPEFENYERLTRAYGVDATSDLGAGLHKFTFKIGPAATSAVANAVQAAVDSVVRFDHRPTPAEMDSLDLCGYFLPYFRYCQLEMVTDPTTYSNSYWVGISLALNCYDRRDSLCFNYQSVHESEGIRKKFMESEWAGWAHGAEFVLASISRDFADAIVSSPEIMIRTAPPPPME